MSAEQHEVRQTGAVEAVPSTEPMNAGPRLGRLLNGNPPAPPFGHGSSARLCGASRSHGRGTCKAPAMANGRCRCHGGLSTGPKTAEGRARCAAAKTLHGRETRAAREQRRELMRAIRAEVARYAAVVRAEAGQ